MWEVVHCNKVKALNIGTFRTKRSVNEVSVNLKVLTSEVLWIEEVKALININCDDFHASGTGYQVFSSYSLSSSKLSSDWAVFACKMLYWLVHVPNVFCPIIAYALLRALC